MTKMSLKAAVVLVLVGYIGAAFVKAAVSPNGTNITINNYAR